MCFSATASFTAGAILSLISLLSIKIARSPYHTTLALVPLCFGIQQAIEGVVWLTLGNSSLLGQASVYGFLFFALIFWPVVIPAFLWWYERIAWRRHIIACSLIAGIGIALCFIFNLMIHGATASLSDYNIYYHLSFASQKIPILIESGIYLFAILLPFFISSRKYMWLLGCAIGISYLVSIIWFSYTMLSVWCFFCAILSGIIGSIIYYANDKESDFLL